MERLSNQNPSTLFAGKKETQLQEAYLTAILVALTKLERHIGCSIDELGKQIYLEGLRELRPEQIERITERLLKTWKSSKMPKIVDFLDLANEKGDVAPPDPRPNSYPLPVLLEEIREIEREICQGMFGKPWHELSSKELLACATEAGRIKVQRMLEAAGKSA